EEEWRVAAGGEDPTCGGLLGQAQLTQVLLPAEEAHPVLPVEHVRRASGGGLEPRCSGEGAERLPRRPAAGAEALRVEDGSVDDFKPDLTTGAPERGGGHPHRLAHAPHPTPCESAVYGNEPPPVLIPEGTRCGPGSDPGPRLTTTPQQRHRHEAQEPEAGHRARARAAAPCREAQRAPIRAGHGRSSLGLRDGAGLSTDDLGGIHLLGIERPVAVVVDTAADGRATVRALRAGRSGGDHERAASILPIRAGRAVADLGRRLNLRLRQGTVPILVHAHDDRLPTVRTG